MVGRLNSDNSNQKNITNLTEEKLGSKVEIWAYSNRRNLSQDDSLIGTILLYKVVERFKIVLFTKFSAIATFCKSPFFSPKVTALDEDCSLLTMSYLPELQ